MDEAVCMQARDLRTGAPRRWTETLDGINWLPRLIDKARAAHAGSLGAYLYGQSPIDRSFLHTIGISHASFARIVKEAPDDTAVVWALAAHDPQSLDRARAWSTRLKHQQRLFLFVLDVDDGYAGGIWKRIKPAVNAAANGLTWTMKRLWPSNAIDRSNQP